MPDWTRLLGVAVVLVGMMLRWRATIVVVAAGLLTGLLAGMPLVTADGGGGVLNLLGRAFADNRLMTLFVITLPAIGLMERYGLQVQSAHVIRRIGAATAGRLLVLYQLFRVTAGALSLRLGGHPTFVRPLVYPMSVGAAAARCGVEPGDLPPKSVETIKAADAASENYGTFYGQNLSPVSAGVLLVVGVMRGLGYGVSVWRLVMFTVPVVVLSVLFGTIQFLLLDRRLRRMITTPQ